MNINIPIQKKSEILSKGDTTSSLVSLRLRLPPVFIVTARYNTPKATPKAPKMPKMAVSTGMPSGQYPPYPDAAADKSACFPLLSDCTSS